MSSTGSECGDALKTVRLATRYCSNYVYPDDETEVYFKAADALVLPYTDIYQSGVLSLGYSFGLPTIATEVGSFREEIIEGETGLICRPADPADLAQAIERYFSSSMYADLTACRTKLRFTLCNGIRGISSPISPYARTKKYSVDPPPGGDLVNPLVSILIPPSMRKPGLRKRCGLQSRRPGTARK